MSKGVGIILAGGKATRLGGVSKADILIGQQTCLEHAHRILAHGLHDIAISGRIKTNLKTLTDWPDKGRGGVAFAVLGALDWAQHCGFDFIITLPVDTPFVPLNFTHQLSAQFKINPKPIAYKNNDHIQGLHALWPVTCLDDLKALVLEHGVCKIELLHEKLESQYVQFPDADYDPFFNVNTQGDLDIARRLFAMS